MKKRTLFFFIFIFLFLSNLKITYSDTIAQWVNGTYFSNISASTINPTDTYSDSLSAGDASIYMTANSCGYATSNKILNPYTCSCIASSCSSSHTCSDSASFSYNCNPNIDQETCTYTLFAHDGGTCSCQCDNETCTCSTCSNSYSNSKSGTFLADTSRFTNDSTKFSFVQLKYESKINDPVYPQIIWYKKPVFIFKISNTDLDDVVVNSYNYDNDLLEPTVYKYSNNEIYGNYSSINSENIYIINFTLYDNDLCKESRKMSFEIAIDNIGPRVFRINKTPLGYYTNHSDKIGNIKLVSLTNVLNNQLGLDDNETIIFKGLSLCKFKPNNCFSFYYGDFASQINNSYLETIKNKNTNFNVKLTKIKELVPILNEERKIVYYQYNFSPNNGYFIGKLKGKDNLKNVNYYNLIIPFSSPITTCKVNKSINSYTQLSRILCNNTYLDTIKNFGILYYKIIYPQDDNYYNPEFKINYDNLSYSFYFNDYLNQVPFNGQTLSLTDNGLEGSTLKNVKVCYFSSDKFNNYENLSEFNFTTKQGTIKPNCMMVNLDYSPPKIIINITNSNLNGAPIISKDIKDLDTENTPIKIEYVPFQFEGICNDKETNICNGKITLDNGSTYYFDKIISLDINYQPQFIVIEIRDGFNNTYTKTLYFYVNNQVPNISISFDKKPLDNYYTFNQNVTLIANASFLGEANKIKNISIYDSQGNLLLKNDSNKIYLKLGCQENQECEYHLKIEAISVLNTVAYKYVNILINKKFLIHNLNIIQSSAYNFIYKNYTYYINNNYLFFSDICFIDKNIEEGKVNNIEIYSNNKLITNKTNANNENPFIVTGKINLDNKGTIVAKCYYETLNSEGSDTKKINYTIDDEGPTITIFINKNEIGSNEFKTNTTEPLNITTNTNDLVGIKKIEIYLNNKLIKISNNNNFSMLLPSLTEGIYNLNIKAYDLLDNLNSKNTKIIIDNTPPIILKQLINREINSITYNFACSDFSQCNITSIKCNEIEKLANPVPSKEITCNFDSSGKINWQICVEDGLKNKDCYNFTDFSIANIINIKLIPDISQFYCVKGSFVPIMLSIQNQYNEFIKVKIIGNNYLVIGSREIEMRPLSSLETLLLLMCFNPLNTLKIEVYNKSELLENITKEIKFNIINSEIINQIMS
ncbi:MAG: hypothetical protein ABGW69_04090 [Nanoarchaeota archaeon]